MFDVLGDLNYLAVGAAVLAAIVLAGLYFAVLVPRYYAVALGRQDAPPAAHTLLSNAGPPVCILVTTFTSAVLLRALHVTGLKDAVVFGLIVGVGYLTAMTYQIAINPNFPRPLYYGALNAPYFIGSSALTSVILVQIE